ncbi:MAG: M20/M25/M40 family metallo-hydrolase [bacterium]|nr:M20/M25/M40 family metallo-hydrolase [bacterium]
MLTQSTQTLAVKALLTLALILALPDHLSGAQSDLRNHVETLASDPWQGRMTGSEGAKATADYLAEQLDALGASPLPGQDGFEIEFEFTAGTSDTGSSVSVVAGPEKNSGKDESFAGTGLVQALSFSEDGSVTAPAVFAGYGMVVPDDGEFSYDSYAGIDVEGKIVVALRYFPEDAEDETRGRLSRFSGLRYKALQARERGAKAMVVLTGPRSPNAGEVVPMAFDAATDSGLLAVSVNGEIAERLISYGSNKTLEQIQKSFDDANPHVTGFNLEGLELTVKASVKRERKIGRNVVGLLPGAPTSGSNGSDGSEAGFEKPYVVVGAHFDHLGKGRTAGSLADKEEADGIHYGADDNASGVAAALAAAGRLAGKAGGRRIVLAFWSGEEIGILGSADFVKEKVLDPEDIAAYINFDMVGRSKDNKLSLQAVGSSPEWSGLIEKSNVPVGFDLSLQEDPYLPTDSSSFNVASVPTLNFFAGSHEDYHRPSDTADKINYEDLERIAHLGALVTTRVSRMEKPPEFVKVERRVEEGGGRDGVRAFTGTIPDYGTEVDGLMLSGVIEGGPADEAGLEGGDVIIEFGGQEISNVYDYTYALDAVKVGEPLKVVYLRDGERKETAITPRAR